MSTSLAAVFSGTAGQLELRQLPMPRPAGAEVLVRVLGCTLCGSDLHSVEGRRSVPVPTVLGHEIVGEIESFGDAPPLDLEGRELHAGDRVTWAVVANCGECFYCRHDLPQKCERAVKYGHEPLRPGRELLGGLAEHCLLVPGTSIVKLPDELPLAVACPASCATATISAALEAAGDVSGGTVCILGAGMLGLTASAMCQAKGAANVLCVDVQSQRRERSLKFGASMATCPHELSAVVAKLTDGRGIDLVIECSGATSAFETAWPLVRLGGRLVLVGAVFPGAAVQLQLEHVVRRQLTLRGIHNYAPRHLLSAVKFLGDNQHRFPFGELVHAWLPLAEAARAFEIASGGEAVRIGVRC